MSNVLQHVEIEGRTYPVPIEVAREIQRLRARLATAESWLESCVNEEAGMKAVRDFLEVRG